MNCVVVGHSFCISFSGFCDAEDVVLLRGRLQHVAEVQKKGFIMIMLDGGKKNFKKERMKKTKN